MEASMDYQERLLKQKEKLEAKLEIQSENQGYYTMLIDLASALAKFATEVERLKKSSSAKYILTANEHQWLDIMEELCESLQMLEEESLKVVKQKKLYEAVDEVIADLEDWIEMVNESIGAETPLAYIEAWDIGMFF